MTEPTHEEMPWVIGLTDEEVQELRNKKQELTEYGKQKIKQMMNQEPYPDAMFEEAERRELINEALIELDAIVMGGQNTREFYLSVSHIRNVLERLK